MSDSATRPSHIVLLGPPASGKGTQGRKLAATLGLGYLSTGALLREQVENATPLGKLAEPILARGGYLPDELMHPLMGDWLAKQPAGWVLDGFPRSLPQAEFLDKWLAARGRKLDVAVLLEVPYEDLLNRICRRVECPDCRWSSQVEQTAADGLCPVCGGAALPRADDTEENFVNRHQEFVRLTSPVINHYEKLHLLKRCDGTANQEEVTANLLDLIGS